MPKDEVYHFYLGDPVDLHLLRANGVLEIIRLGPNLGGGEHPQAIVPAGVWQGSRLAPGGEWALLGTTVHPGFEFADLRLADGSLLERFPTTSTFRRLQPLRPCRVDRYNGPILHGSRCEMSSCRRLIALTVGLRVRPSMCQAGDWPQLRGPNGSATTEDAKLPIQWSDSNILWKTPLPGLGVSSAVVSGDAVYLTFANPDGTQRTLARYDAKTGKEVWRRTLSFSTHKKHSKNSYATATPATDGERVAVLFADQEKFLVVVYSSKGDELWRNDVGGFSGEHGAGGSPIIEAGKVYFAKEQDGASSLFAFDLKTGMKVWQTDYSVKVATYSTPIVYRGPDGQTCLVCSHSHTGLAGYDLATGKRLWKCDGFELRTVGMPVQAGTIVAATAGQGGSGKMLLAVDLSSSPTGDAELQPAYTLQRGIPYCTTPVAVGDRLLFRHGQRASPGVSTRRPVRRYGRTGSAVHIQRRPSTLMESSSSFPRTAK